MNFQPGILRDVPPLARYMSFSFIPGANVQRAIDAIVESINIDNTVLGLGNAFITSCKASIPGMRDFPVITAPGIEIPSTPTALWLWLKGEDKGELLHRARAYEHALAEHFDLTMVTDAFKYEEGRDITGYIDGTENPIGNDAVSAAFVQGQKDGMNGSSFVAVQQWLHNLDSFYAMNQQQRDHSFGRRLVDNEELSDAPPSAHVKRTAQESFSPEAFVLRRSMPWASEQNTGLVFVAFGHTFDAYETLLRNMTGENDGITDALFNFTQPLSGAYLWCPPVKNGKLDLSILKNN